MAKKFVRGITDIKNIEHQDFDTNNVNDLLSDGKHNYIHRKKQDGSEEYHNLTNNIKTIQSDDTDLLTVTNYNNTTNSATLRPKHDSQKEQVLESTDETILISHGENGTEETTSVDVNFEKVQEKLTAGDGVSIIDDTISLKFLEQYSGDLNDLTYTCIAKPSDNALNLPPYSEVYGNGILSTVRVGDVAIQKYHPFSGNKVYIRSCRRLPSNPTWSVWSEEVDKTTIENLLSQKQNTLTSNASIGVVDGGTGLRLVYYHDQTYYNTNAVLTTYAIQIGRPDHPEITKEIYNFYCKINKSIGSCSFTLEGHDKDVFYKLLGGENKTLDIQGVAFTLTGDDGETLNVVTNNTTYNDYAITFSDMFNSHSS